MITYDKQRCIDWMAQWAGSKFGFDNYQQAIGEERDGKLVAVVNYAHYTGTDIEMGLLVDRAPSRTFVRAAFAYPFVQLGCRRVTAEVASLNRPMLALMERLGFTYEGLKRDALPDDNYMVFGMTRTECRYI